MNLGGEKALRTCKDYWLNSEERCEGHEPCVSLDDFLKNHPPNPNFSASPYYDRDGDALELVFTNDASYSVPHFCPATGWEVATSQWDQEIENRLVGVRVNDIVQALAGSGYVILDSREYEQLTDQHQSV